jgi:hypothetical protein
MAKIASTANAPNPANPCTAAKKTSVLLVNPVSAKPCSQASAPKPAKAIAIAHKGITASMAAASMTPLSPAIFTAVPIPIAPLTMSAITPTDKGIIAPLNAANLHAIATKVKTATSGVVFRLIHQYSVVAKSAVPVVKVVKILKINGKLAPPPHHANTSATANKVKIATKAYVLAYIRPSIAVPKSAVLAVNPVTMTKIN